MSDTKRHIRRSTACRRGTVLDHLYEWFTYMTCFRFSKQHKRFTSRGLRPTLTGLPALAAPSCPWAEVGSVSDWSKQASKLSSFVWGKSAKCQRYKQTSYRAVQLCMREVRSGSDLSIIWPVLRERSSEALADELAELYFYGFQLWSRIPRIFQERIMGAGTALGLYNVSLQYQQHNASHANCISSSAEHKRIQKRRIWMIFSFEPAS